MSAPMEATRHVRLYRPGMYQQLARLSRKHKKLNYPRFCVQAFSELNPDFTSDPDDNFSILESVRGFLSPKPLSSPYRQGDLRLFIDSLGRPDVYSLKRLNRQRLDWNNGIEGSTLRLKRVFYPVKLTYPATKRREEYTETVLYDYLQIVRGKQAVAQIDEHLQNMTNGIEDVRTDLQQCANARNVDREIERILEENRNIENGRGP